MFEVFDHRKRSRTVTIGYRLGRPYWHLELASEACRLMVGFLSETEDVDHLAAYVMPENLYSAKVLLKNGFAKMPFTQEGRGRHEKTELDVYMLSLRK